MGIYRAFLVPRRRCGASRGAPGLGEDTLGVHTHAHTRKHTHTHPLTQKVSVFLPRSLDPNLYITPESLGSYHRPGGGTKEDTHLSHGDIGICPRALFPSLSKVRGQHEGALREPGSGQSRKGRGEMK